MIKLSKENGLSCKMRKTFKGIVIILSKISKMLKFCQRVELYKNFKNCRKKGWLFHETFCKSYFKSGKIRFPKMTK